MLWHGRKLLPGVSPRVTARNHCQHKCALAANGTAPFPAGQAAIRFRRESRRETTTSKCALVANETAPPPAGQATNRKRDDIRDYVYRRSFIGVGQRHPRAAGQRHFGGAGEIPL